MAASHFLVGAKSEAFRTRNVRKSSGTCEDWSRDRSHKLIGIEGAIISTLHFAILPKTSLVIGQVENGDFFCFSLLSTRKRRFREPETKFFLERRVLVYVWTDGNGGFWIRWCRTYYYHYACPVLKGCYRISIVLAFSSGRAKTIQIRYLWTPVFLKTEIFSSDLKNMWIRVAIMAISEIVWFSLYIVSSALFRLRLRLCCYWTAAYKIMWRVWPA